MDNIQREEFWKTICSFKGDDVQNDLKKLANKIIYPRNLFRYRSVNNNNLEALRTNKVYFSKASKYDDPFDTFLYIDIEKIRFEFESNFRSQENVTNLAKAMQEILQSVPNALSNDYTKKMITPNGLEELYENGITNQFLSYALTLRTRIQDKILSACFSENGFNENLWLKYADMHRGFALMYDLQDTENYHCGKKERCRNCGINQYGISIYPINYSNKPYNATEFAKVIMAQEMENQLHVQLPEFIKRELNNLNWEKERVSLIKKECHKYDEEWRILTNCNMENASIEWIPSGIILGLRTPIVEANLLIAMAKEAGIKNIYKSYIDQNNCLNAYLINEF